MNSKKRHLIRLILAALFTAIVTVMTMIVQIPSPMNGYVNLGDCFVILSAWILGPVYGTAAAATGSMLADVFSGYAIYAPATFIIKGLMALVAYAIGKLLSRKKGSISIPAKIVSATAAEAVMVVGYFLYAALIFGNGLSAAVEIPANLMQGLMGLVSSVALGIVLDRSGVFSGIR